MVSGLLCAVRDLASAKNLQNVMDVVRLAARELTGADGITFVLREGNCCHYAEENAIAPLWKGKKFPLSNCISGWVMLNKQAVSIEDIYQDPRIPHDAYRPTFVKSLAMVPVRREDPVAAVGAYWATRHTATFDELESLQCLADAASLALVNVRLCAELGTSEQNLQLLIEHAPVSLAMFDLEMRYLAVSRRWLTEYGLTGRRILGHSHYEIFPEIPECWKQAHRRGLAGEVVTSEEDRFERADGSVQWLRWQIRPWFDTAGRIGGIVIFTEDITERKRAEESLRHSQQRLELALTGADLGAWDWNVSTGELSFNPRWAGMLGYAQEEIEPTANGWEKLVHPDDQPAVLEALNAHLEGEADSYAAQYRLQHKSGEWVWIADRGRVIERDAAGRPRRMCGTHLDITEQRQLEERLRQAEKMDAIGQLAGGVAHDFNNQLSGILGYADLLLFKLEDPALRKYAQNVMTASRYAADLTKKLLAFARKGQYQTVPVDIHQLIRETADFLRHSLDKRIIMRQRLEADRTVVVGDPSQLQNALLNLGINARDAMPEGGELVFGTALVQVDDDFKATHEWNLPKGECLMVSVSDNGCGMTPAVQARIFEPFFTTKEVGKGTGMGLAAVYGTVKLHQGAINVYSEPGLGTVFKLYLPLAEVGTDTAGSTGTQPALPKMRILVADDEEILREVLAEMLATAGHTVLTAANGEEAIGLYADQWREIDLVILDMIMPEVNGRDTFRRLKEINPRVKALLTSGFGVNGQAQSILDEGVRGFVQKPFERNDLTRRLAEALRKPG